MLLSEVRKLFNKTSYIKNKFSSFILTINNVELCISILNSQNTFSQNV